MTAINIVLQRDAAHVITDGAHYLPTGELTGSCSKVYPLPHFPAAIAARGPIIGQNCIAAGLMGHFSTFDAMIEGVEVAFPNLYDEFSPTWLNAGGIDRIELYLIGWSEARRAFEAYRIGTALSFADGAEMGVDTAGCEEYEEFKLYPIPEPVSCAPLVSLDAAREFGLKANGPGDFRPEPDGLAILEAQRRIKAALLPGQPPTHHVGVFAQRTTITRNGIEQRIFHRWDSDRVGEYIKPEESPIVRPAENVVPMNRQQRRAMERAGRR